MNSKIVCPVFIYTPKNATFYGGEGRVDFHLLPLEITRPNEPSDSKSVKNVIMGGEETTQKNPNDLYLRLQADYVHAEDSSGEPLPRITPFPLRHLAQLRERTLACQHRRLACERSK